MISNNIPFLFALILGFYHAFEADHVLAVGNIANRRASFWMSVKDGVFWGLGHMSMIMLIGVFIIVAKVMIVKEVTFDFFEVLVGISMIGLGVFRVIKGGNDEDHVHMVDKKDFKLAYSIGLVHGLAGSGAVILLAMSEINGYYAGLVYLLMFGVGSIVGMMVVAGVFNLPFLRALSAKKEYRKILVAISAVLCAGYGLWMVVRYFI